MHFLTNLASLFDVNLDKALYVRVVLRALQLLAEKRKLLKVLRIRFKTRRLRPRRNRENLALGRSLAAGYSASTRQPSPTFLVVVGSARILCVPSGSFFEDRFTGSFGESSNTPKSPEKNASNRMNTRIAPLPVKRSHPGLRASEL